jgi:hypothetical protein
VSIGVLSWLMYWALQIAQFSYRESTEAPPNIFKKNHKKTIDFDS